MRKDIDLIAVNKNLAVLRINDRYFKLETKDSKKLKEDFLRIKENNINNNKFQEQLLALLNKVNAFCSINNTYELLSSLGIDLPILKDMYQIKTGILGENDLIEKYKSFTPRWKVINLNDNPSAEFDIGIIMNRKFNYNLALQNNNNMFKKGKPYISLLFKPLMFELGPETIPGQTSCLNCKRLWEVNNINDGNLVSIFDESHEISNQYILEELFPFAFSVLNMQILNTILNLNGFNIEMSLTQKSICYSFLDGNLVNHNILKNQKCPLCFDNYQHSLEQVFEV